MRQLPLVVGLFVCLGLAACSASQDNSASADTAKISAAERPEAAATEQAPVTEGAVTSATPLTHVSINGKQVDPALGWVMTTPFNMMSRCPVLTVPSGRASSGVPT